MPKYTKRMWNFHVTLFVTETVTQLVYRIYMEAINFILDNALLILFFSAILALFIYGLGDNDTLEDKK